MSCAIAPETVEQTIAFHGHSCPGLTIGIRAAELALNELGHPEAGDMVAVVETDMCGVDAIQFLTGCTVGKGNLLLLDHGKMAFSFFCRSTGKGVRLVFNKEAWGGKEQEMSRFMKRLAEGSASEEERLEAARLREELRKRLMEMDLERMFTRTALREPPPRAARIHESLACEECGEMTMESRTRRFQGKTLCIPCFRQHDRRF